MTVRDTRTDAEKIDAIVEAVAERSFSVDGYGIAGASQVAMSTGIKLRDITRLMPRAVTRSAALYPGYRLVVNNRERVYRLVDTLTADDARTIIGRATSGATRLRRAAEESDVANADPATKMVAASWAAAATTAEAATEFLRSQQEQPV